MARLPGDIPPWSGRVRMDNSGGTCCCCGLLAGFIGGPATIGAKCGCNGGAELPMGPPRMCGGGIPPPSMAGGICTEPTGSTCGIGVNDGLCSESGRGGGVYDGLCSESGRGGGVNDGLCSNDPIGGPCINGGLCGIRSTGGGAYEGMPPCDTIGGGGTYDGRCCSGGTGEPRDPTGGGTYGRGCGGCC